MKKTQILFYALATLVVGVCIIYFRFNAKQPVNMFTQEERKKLREWHNMPFVPISATSDFRDFISNIPLDLQTSITLNQDASLRSSIRDLLLILNTADYDKFASFQMVRKQSEFVETGVDFIGRGRNIDVNRPKREVYKDIWADYYSEIGQTGPFESISSTETVITVLPRKPLNVSSSNFPKRLIDQYLKTNSAGGRLAGTLLQKNRTRLDGSFSSTTVVFKTTVRPKGGQQEAPWVFVFEYQPDIRNWVLVTYFEFYFGPPQQYWPLL